MSRTISINEALLAPQSGRNGGIARLRALPLSQRFFMEQAERDRHHNIIRNSTAPINSDPNLLDKFTTRSFRPSLSRAFSEGLHPRNKEIWLRDHGPHAQCPIQHYLRWKLVGDGRHVNIHCETCQRVVLSIVTDPSGNLRAESAPSINESVTSVYCTDNPQLVSSIDSTIHSRGVEAFEETANTERIESTGANHDSFTGAAPGIMRDQSRFANDHLTENQNATTAVFTRNNETRQQKRFGGLKRFVKATLRRVAHVEVKVEIRRLPKPKKPSQRRDTTPVLPTSEDASRLSESSTVPPEDPPILPSVDPQHESSIAGYGAHESNPPESLLTNESGDQGHDVHSQGSHITANSNRETEARTKHRICMCSSSCGCCNNSAVSISNWGRRGSSPPLSVTSTDHPPSEVPSRIDRETFRNMDGPSRGQFSSRRDSPHSVAVRNAMTQMGPSSHTNTLSTAPPTPLNVRRLSPLSFSVQTQDMLTDNGSEHGSEHGSRRDNRRGNGSGSGSGDSYTFSSTHSHETQIPTSTPRSSSPQLRRESLARERIQVLDTVHQSEEPEESSPDQERRIESGVADEREEYDHRRLHQRQSDGHLNDENENDGETIPTDTRNPSRETTLVDSDIEDLYSAVDE